MRPVVFVVPGQLDTPTGGYVYDRRMIEGLRLRGWPVEVREIEGAFPFPTPADLDRAATVLAAIPDRALVLVDGLALGAMPEAIEREASRLRVVAIVHLPLGADIGLDPGTAARLEAAERRALGAAALVIVTGAPTVAMLAHYGIARERIAVVEPGTASAPVARGSGGTPVRLLTVATLNPGKGHEPLLRALSALPHRGWHLTCAGSTSRHPETTARVRAAIDRFGLGAHVTLAGELDAAALDACYDAADVFVLATLQETYGMAVAEAVARGLPVVSTTTGAIPDLVGTDAGLLTAPGDVEALTAALGRVIDDGPLRGRLAEGARRARARLPTWDQACDKMAAALGRVDVAHE